MPVPFNSARAPYLLKILSPKRPGILIFLSLVTILHSWRCKNIYHTIHPDIFSQCMYKVPTIRRGALEAGAVVGAPRGHHRDVLRVKGCSRGRGESRVRMSRVRVSRVRMTRTSVRTHRRRGAARVAGERVMRRVCLHPVLPGRRLFPSGKINPNINHHKYILIVRTFFIFYLFYFKKIKI